MGCTMSMNVLPEHARRFAAQHPRLDHLPEGVREYAVAVAQRLQGLLAGEFVGVYMVGSVALGGFAEGRSDIDIQGVCAEPLARGRKDEVVDALAHPALDCPARGCEFVLYRREAVAVASARGAYEINLNSGPRMALHVSYDPSEDPAFWFVLDRAILRDHGVRLLGPEPRELVAPIPYAWIREALLTALRWHVDNDLSVGADSVLNACRAWRFSEERRWSSKVDAAAWARAHADASSIIDKALVVRAGGRAQPLKAERVRSFLDEVAQRVASSGE
jgi:hypothetical protein